ncbi:RNA polymerase sigma factor [Dulcicalothrix desertica PCC 7102]|uniref:RNA polymerase sigma factor n=1 Tax=Dulcicalothrix desertica PCC 7102 TaxID=232991 RepID=A0A433VE48_9CYAN|nr:RNA polymerase sigma factor, RpoD/SigA family [Dulcicalothrix desertica]RUT04385.1 RNA polymerase sigma factor [Dulcicalothrix desertica PCC 7102]TWH51239.1 RNA polymerase nonessential primary-like sigma factor [Dulcicalothrix desertica PCC 7102]
MTSKTSKSSQSKTDLVQVYLKEIGKIPLLTYEQEVLLAQQVQQMMFILAAEEQLAIELERTPTLEEWANKINVDKKILLQQLKLGKKAKQKMILSNLRLVVTIAKKYQQRNLEFLDLIQEGTLGLERGVKKYDPSLGYKFSTYAYWWIRQGITRAISQKGRTIRLPVHVHETLNKVKRAQHELSQQLGRIPSTNEIADALSLQPTQIRECLLLNRQSISLDIRVGMEQDTLLHDLIEDSRPSPENHLLKESNYQDIKNLLSRLSHQQQEVLTLRFGLVDGRELSLAQIGKHLGLSRERIRQIEQKALTVLRQHL